MGDRIPAQDSSANLLRNTSRVEIDEYQDGVPDRMWMDKSPDGSKNTSPPGYQIVVETPTGNAEYEDDINVLASSTQPLRMDFEDTKDDDEDEEKDDEDPHKPRGNWGGRFDFLVSLLGYSVGLGNVWRFPYLAYQNGGGAFVIPFIIMLILVGIPLMFMEMAFGQYASLGPTAIFGKFCPLFHGLGFGMVIISGVVSLYYNVILAWTIFYIAATFTTVLPWESCDEKWASHECYSFVDADRCKAINNSVYFNATCITSNATEHLDYLRGLAQNATRKTPAEDYFENYVLELTDGIDNVGPVKWQLLLCLLLAWLIVFACLSRGVQSFGKVAYFTALFPYVVLFILLIRGVTLPGSVDGIKFYLTPEWHRLAKAKVWVEAAVQIFFSLSPAWGGLIALASYNKFNNNCFKDSLIVSIGNISTSIFAGIVIFAIVGYLAHELDEKVGDVVAQGAGLAFMVYPEVVTRLPISPLWSFLFFLMLLTLGLGSMFATSETVTTSFLDLFPQWRKRKVFVVLAWALIGLVGGMPMCTRGGMYILQLMDTYAASWSVFIFASLESLLVGWVYGADRFCKDIEQMIGPRSRAFKMIFSFFWRFLSPATLIFLLFFNWIQYKPIEYAGKPYPAWADAVGWMLSLVPVIVVVSMSVFKIVTTQNEGKTFWQKIKYLSQPHASWGPANTKNRYDSVSVQYTP